MELHTSSATSARFSAFAPELAKSCGSRAPTEARAASNRSPPEHGRWIKFDYDLYSRVTRARDNAGRAATYTYDATGRLASATNPRGHTSHYTYVDGKMTEVKDNRGITFLKNIYDAQDRVVRQEQADGTEYLFSYEDNSQAGDCAAGGTQVFCASINQATTVTDPGGTKRRVEFDSDGYSTKDIAGYQGSKEQETAYTRDADTNLVERVTDPLGRKTDLSYDSAGNITQRTDAADSDAAATTEYAYDSKFGLIKTVAGTAGRQLRWERDGRGRVTASVWPSGRKTTYGYSGSEPSPSSVTAPGGGTTTIEYDRGSPSLIRDPLGRETRLLTDAAGRDVAVTDPAGQRSSVAYDDADQATKITAPGGAATTFSYDPNGNVTEVTNARGKSRTATYDNMNRVATHTDQLGRSESFDYDADGKMTQRVDRKGQATIFAYDALGRPTQARFGASEGGQQSLISHSYDDGNRLISVQDSEAGNYGLAWDRFDRLTSETSSNGTVSYGYDDVGRRTSMQAPGVGSTSYTYDDDDRLTGVTRGGQSVSLGYDQAGRRSSLNLPGGVSQDYGYDAASQLTRIGYANNSESLGEIRYAYDAAGRRDAMWGAAARTLLPPNRGPMSYDDADQLATEAGKPVTYDANGQVTGRAGRSYGWDARGKLISITGGEQPNSAFSYDPFGRRTSRTVDGDETTYAYEGQNVLTEQRQGGGQTSLLNGRGMDERFTRTDGGDTQAFLTDALGSTLHLAGADGDPVTSYAYDPFGRTASSGESSDNRFQYTGRENEGGGMQYNRARYYMPGTGRFTSEDPLGLAGGDANYHAYVGGDPVARTDPSGLLFGGLFSGDLAERYVGAFDGLTLGGTSYVRRELLGISNNGYGGLNTCESGYAMSRAIGRITTGIAGGTLVGGVVPAMAGGGLASGAAGGALGGATGTTIVNGGSPTGGQLATGAGIGATGGVAGSFVAGPLAGPLTSIRNPMNMEQVFGRSSSIITSQTLGVATGASGGLSAPKEGCS